MHVKNQAAEQQLREEFKKINWWARNKYFDALITMLCLSIILLWLMNIDFDHFFKHHRDTAIAMPLLTLIGTVCVLTTMVTVRCFFEVKPWQKYKKLHMPPEQEDEDDLSMSG